MKTKRPFKHSAIAFFVVAVAFALASPSLRAQGMAMDGMKMPGIMFGMNALMYAKGHLHGEEDDHDSHSEDGHGASLEEGIGIEEAKLGFMSDVDSYMRTMIHVEFHDDELRFADLYVQNLERIWWMTLKVGRFYPMFGAHNHVHSHSLPFANRSPHQELVLGEELLEFGLALNVDFPLPWFELVLDAAWMQGDNEALFHLEGGRQQKLLQAGWGARSTRLMARFDFEGRQTLEVGGSFAWGRNNFSSRKEKNDTETGVDAFDITYKLLDADRKGEHVLMMNLEWMLRSLRNNRFKDLKVDKHVGGLHALVQYKFMRPFYAQYRYAVAGSFPRQEFVDVDFDELEQLHSFALALVPTKKTMFRLQYDLGQHDGDLSGELIGQLSFSIGAHSGHSYFK